MTGPGRPVRPIAGRRVVARALSNFRAWMYAGERERPKGTLEAAVSVVSRLRDGGPADRDSNLTAGQGQVRTSRPAVIAVFQEFDVPGAPSQELGRTSRGTVGAITTLLASLVKGGWEALGPDDRAVAATEMLRELTTGITAYLMRENLDVPVGAAITPTRLVEIILETASERSGAGGKVAQHLVGAKLAVRFEGEHEVGQDRMAAADSPTGRNGDFQFGNAAFHVTLAPADPVMDKCQANVDAGIHPVLLVPYERLDQARHNCEDRGLRDKVSVYSIAEFVGGNVDEIGNYRDTQTRSALVRVLDEYNRRMIEIEADQSLTVTVPDQLRQTLGDQ